jgi:hypothetical protein
MGIPITKVLSAKPANLPLDPADAYHSSVFLPPEININNLLSTCP